MTENLHIKWDKLIREWLIKAADGRKRKKATKEFIIAKRFLQSKYNNKTIYEIHLI